MNKTGCQDCGLDYAAPGWIDAIVADDVWALLIGNNDGGGILCITCMQRRAKRLGLENIPVSLRSGAFVTGRVVSIQPIRLEIVDDELADKS